MQQQIQFESYQSFVGRPLVELPNELVRTAQRLRHRPTVKAVLFKGVNSKRHPVATYRGALPWVKGARVFNLPGGGVDYRRTWIAGLQQELKEELPQFEVRQKDLHDAIILSVRVLGTSRKGFRGKLAVLVGISVPNERFVETSLRPDGKELSDLVIHDSISKAALRLAELTDTKLDARAWYQDGLGNLRAMLNA